MVFRVINKTGKEKIYSEPQDDEITRIVSTISMIDSFLQGVIFKEYRDNLIEEDTYSTKRSKFQYMDSILTRIETFRVLRTEFNYTIDDFIADHKEYEGFPIPRYNGIKLLSIYKQYIDTIYNIMENVSRFNLFWLCPNMPHNFNSQCKKISEGAYSVPQKYENIIKNDMDWYQEVHLMRSNMNHFLIGDYDTKKTENGELIFIYENINLSHRTPHIEKTHYISRNISKDIDNFEVSLFAVLQKIFLVYVEKTGQKAKGYFIKYTADGANVHELNFQEFMRHEKGKIVESLSAMTDDMNKTKI